MEAEYRGVNLVPHHFARLQIWKDGRIWMATIVGMISWMEIVSIEVDHIDIIMENSEVSLL